MQACRLAATDLACRRGDRVLFAGLSVELIPGEALHIAGANGIGKSSLIRILAGLLPPFAGSVEATGAIGLIDERPALDPQLPLGRALAFWRRLDGPADNGADRLGLTNLLDVPVRYLSTGQKKRAALARLIGQQAPVWLLDEPLNGLDSAAIALVEELTADHLAAGGLAVIASHQPFGLKGMRRIELAQFSPPVELCSTASQGRGSESWSGAAGPSRSGVGPLLRRRASRTDPTPNPSPDGEGLS